MFSSGFGSGFGSGFVLRFSARHAAMAERAAREARSYGVLFRRCWKLVGVSLVLSMHRDIDWQLVPPYFY
eukprot:COSAG04_NODE_22372_length_356_cov_0.622568_1_plen_69_part_10